MAKMSGVSWAVIALVALMGFQVIPNPYLNFTGSSTPSGTTVVNQAGESVVVTPSCYGQTTAVTYSHIDKYNNSATTAGTQNIKVNGFAPIATYATGAGGDRVVYLDYARNRFTAPSAEIVLPCNAKTIEITSMDNATHSSFTVADPTTLTILSNQIATGGGANNLTIGSGSSATVNVNIKAGSRSGLAPFGAIVCLESDKSIFDQTLTRINGLTASSITPSVLSPSATTHAFKCYDYTGDLSDSKDLSFTVDEKAISGQNPIGTTITYVHVVAKNWFKDVDGTFKLGVQDSDTTTFAPSVYAYRWAHI